MRKIIAFTHATLDGYIDDPHKWSFQYSGEEFQDTDRRRRHHLGHRPADRAAGSPCSPRQQGHR